MYMMVALITYLNSELFIPHRIEIVVYHRSLCNSSVAQSNVHKGVRHILRSRLNKLISHFSLSLSSSHRLISVSLVSLAFDVIPQFFFHPASLPHPSPSPIPFPLFSPLLIFILLSFFFFSFSLLLSSERCKFGILREPSCRTTR